LFHRILENFNFEFERLVISPLATYPIDRNRPQQAVTSVVLCSTSDVKIGIIYAHLLQIRVISSMEPEICKKMLRNLSEKLRAKINFLRLHVAAVW